MSKTDWYAMLVFAGVLSFVGGAVFGFFHAAGVI